MSSSFPIREDVYGKNPKRIGKLLQAGRQGAGRGGDGADDKTCRSPRAAVAWRGRDIPFFKNMFSCKFCSAQNGTIKQHLDHRKYHRNVSEFIHCGFHGCTVSCSQEKAWRMHLIRNHGFKAKQNNFQLQETVANSDGSYQCTVDICLKVLHNYDIFMKHLKDHMKEGLNVICPFTKCDRKYSLVSSFTSHISRHKHDNIAGVSDILTTVDDNHSDFTLFDEDGMEDPVASCSSTEGDTAEFDVQELFMNNLAQFFLKLETQFMVPASTVQYISDELFNIDQLGTDILLKSIDGSLRKIGLDDQQTNKILKELEGSNPFPMAHVKLKSNYLRKKMYHNYLGYVEPKQYVCGIGANGKNKVFHYVPIDASLKAMLNDPAIESALLSETFNRDENLFEDFYDGSVFKNNDFFKENPDSIKIILYQDEFEVVCAIGPAKNKYKILAVYYSLGNLPPHLRSDPKNIQLVALCRKKFFMPEILFKKIVEDLKVLETVGVELKPNCFTKASIVTIAGDNLGSHALGGFVENFSRSNYFCRYCRIHRKDLNKFEFTASAGSEFESQSEEEVLSDSSSDTETLEQEVELEEDEQGESCDEDSDSGSDETESYISDEDEGNEIFVQTAQYTPKVFPKRTVDSYNYAVSKVKGSVKSYEGVKYNSVFNTLENYHVCLPGLSPCLAHDWTEGIITYDLALFIKYFVDKQWISYESLKSRIEAFKYSTIDVQDKPVPPCDGAKKLVGGAWQIWTLLRLLPLLIGDKIQTVNDPVWLAVLRLIEIMEIITAPVIHKSFLGQLQYLINDFLSLRVSTFPSVPIRPKHHYVTHYPKLIQEMGNLMKVWTLRFETKHSFFKQLTRVMRNFKNITYSLAEKHQLFQAYLRLGARGDYETFSASEKVLFHFNLYNEELQTAVYKAELVGDIFECSKLIYKGSAYQKGKVVVMAQEYYNSNVVMGRIALLLVDDIQSFLVLEVLQTEFAAPMRVFKLKERIRYECVTLDSLLSLEPLHVYTLDTSPCVKLKHGLVSQEMM
ncbi:Transcriptional repressor protein YY1 [Frankliniella fusca]|uniref:Transcriptional repressor protein YY1 n=1 Tax=Frankliniella fusca TaxID=407009 RepID=A0AAE1HGM5_9NEOP|nr:Transcriptional repressor protein YY1 [Frankliniella fusca]